MCVCGVWLHQEACNKMFVRMMSLCKPFFLCNSEDNIWYCLHLRGSVWQRSHCGHLQRDPPGHIHKRPSSSVDPQHVFCSSLRRLNAPPEDHNQGSPDAEARQHPSDPDAQVQGSNQSPAAGQQSYWPQTSGSGCQAPLV